MGGGTSKPKKIEQSELRDPLYNAEASAAQQPISEDLTKYAAGDAPAADTTEADILGPEPSMRELSAVGVSMSFAPPGGGDGKTIRRQSTAGGLVDSFGSLKPSDGQSMMNKVDLGKLHAALSGDELVSEAKFASTLKSLLPPADQPDAEVIKALFKAFDTDGSGEVDQKELIAGCQALCSGDENTKLRLAFSCFDKDGDGHLTPDELKLLLKGTIEPAVTALHSALDFASFGADDDQQLLEAINEEANGTAALAADNAAEGTINVVLNTKAGAATISVPSAALTAADAATGALSLDTFLSALVDGAIEKYDADKNGQIEVDEFVNFAKENPFLSVWFGHLANENKGASWKDSDLAL